MRKTWMNKTGPTTVGLEDTPEALHPRPGCLGLAAPFDAPLLQGLLLRARRALELPPHGAT